MNLSEEERARNWRAFLTLSTLRSLNRRRRRERRKERRDEEREREITSNAPGKIGDEGGGELREGKFRATLPASFVIPR